MFQKRSLMPVVSYLERINSEEKFSVENPYFFAYPPM